MIKHGSGLADSFFWGCAIAALRQSQCVVRESQADCEMLRAAYCNLPWQREECKVFSLLDCIENGRFVYKAYSFMEAKYWPDSATFFESHAPTDLVKTQG
jgi:hypothetical protein